MDIRRRDASCRRPADLDANSCRLRWRHRLSGSLGRAIAQGRLTQEDLLRFESARQRHAHPRDGHPRAARSAAFPRAVRQHRRRRGQGRRPSHQRQGLSWRGSALSAKSPEAYALTDQDFAELARAYGRMGGLDRIATVVKSDPRRAAGPHAAARRRRHLDQQLDVAADQGAGHGRCHEPARARCHDRPLGVHARRGARQGDRRQAAVSRSWRRTSATPSSRTRSSPPTRCSSAAASRSPSSARPFPSRRSPIRAG